MKIIQSREEFLELFNNKRIAILAFNKDARNLLRFLEKDLKVVNLDIKYIIDLTLGYRDKVKEKVLEVTGKEKIISDPLKLSDAISDTNIDILMCFDRFGSMYSSERPLENFQDCYDWLKEDYDKYIAQEQSSSAQYNFRWRIDISDYINWYAAQQGIHIVSPYWNDLFPYDNPHIKEKTASMTNFVSVRMLELAQYLPTIDPGLRDAKVRFILGSDYGVGKTSFLLNRMQEGSFGIAEDAWFALVSEYFIPVISSFDLKGYIANEIYNAWLKDSKKDIYIKLGGRLEEYVYGIPTDFRMWLDNLPGFFRNVRFDIILKPDQTKNDIEDTLNDFKRYYGLSDDKIALYNMDYDGYAEETK